MRSPEPTSFSEGTLAVTRSILSVPVWRAGQEVPPAPAGGRRLVVLCDLPAIGLPGVQTAEVTTGGDAPHIAYERAAVRLFGELKRLMSTSDGRPCVVQVACRADSLYRGLLGLLRTAAQEDPGLTVRLVEFTYEPSAADLVTALNGQGEHVRHTPAGREAVTWEPVARTTASPVWRDGGVYLISGGAGGIGRLLAEDVARHAPNAVVVRCGRSATADGPGEYHRVDVTDATAVRELIASIVRTHGRIDGILHAAALLRDDYLIRASYQDFLRVLAPKVAGLVHLDEASRDLPLDFFAAFSAAAGNLGNAGQAAYTAANGFLDTYAAHRQELVTRGERHGLSVSLAWPLWRDGGMHVPDEELPALIERFGPPLPTEAALAALHGAVELGATHVVISGEGTVMTGTDDLRGRVLDGSRA